MPLNYTKNYQFVVPSAAAATSVTPSGVAWTNSAYVQLIASTSEADMLTGIVIATAGVGVQFEVDIAVGPAASEVPISTFKGFLADTSHVSDEGGILRAPIGIDAIPSGARVSIRIRINSTNVTVWTFAATYLKKPIVGNLTVTAKPIKVIPSAAVLATLTAGTAGWGNVAWTQLTAAAATAQALVAFILSLVSATADYELDVGVGAAGAEVAITTYRNSSKASTLGGPSWHALVNPLNAIPIGARVSMRWRTAAAELTGLGVGYAYHEGPL